MKHFLSHRLYGVRPLSHFDAYVKQPGWVFIEVASWTLELDYEPRALRLKLAALAALLVTLASVLRPVIQ